MQNRVTPFGAIVADPARGTVMGNRGGMFHDPATLTLSDRRWASRRWLCCSLHYAGSHRHPVWSRGYTQLFFLDEVTALAAGHRPCAECRRTAARAFQASAADCDPAPSLADLDRKLHRERIGEGARSAHKAAYTLPEGAMFAIEDEPYAVRRGCALAWSPGGYGPASPLPSELVRPLTPPTILAALAAGYQPMWHPTASAKANGRLADPSGPC